MKAIEIYRPGSHVPGQLGIADSRFYQAAFLEDGKPDREIVSLFGTHVLPAPYGPSADAETVRADVAGRNPGTTVTVRDQILASLEATS